MSVLLETHWGELVVDVDLEGSPAASRNFLKLVKARQYTQSLFYRIHREHTTTTTPTTTANESGAAAATANDEGKVVIACAGCPRGDGKGGASIDAYLGADGELKDDADVVDLEGIVEKSSVRFLKSRLAGRGLRACELVKGDVVALCVDGIPDTIGSQFGIVVESTHRAPPDDNPSTASSSALSYAPLYVSLGKVAEDEAGVLDRLAGTYCDDESAAASLGRPLVDIRVVRALVVHDPYDDPPGLARLMRRRGVVLDEGDSGGNNGETPRVLSSPSPDRPPTEAVSERVPVHEVEEELDEEKLKEREEQALKKEDKGRAIVLEMLGDLPDADIRAPENVLFICKLNPVTQDEDLELIFSRFDPAVKVDIIRDHDTGASLQYAFAEFKTQAQAAEAYFKMNNALVDDRRIKVDFSQSVATIWDKYRQRMRRGGAKNSAMPRLGPSFDSNRNRGGAGAGGVERRRDQHSRDGVSQSRNRESSGRRSSERQPSDRHRHDAPRRDYSRGDSRFSNRQAAEPRRSFGDDEDRRDEFGRVKGWDSRGVGGGGDTRRVERHGYDSSLRDRDERGSSARNSDGGRRTDSRRDEGGRKRHYDLDRDRDGDQRPLEREARHEHRSDQRRYNGDRDNRRGHEESASRNRGGSPPVNGKEQHRSRRIESPARDRRGHRHRDSSVSHSDTDSRSSHHHRKRKKDKRKHHKKRKRRAYSNVEDEESGDDARSKDRARDDDKYRKKRSKHRDDDDDRSSDDRSSRKHSKHRKRNRRSQSRSRS